MLQTFIRLFQIRKQTLNPFALRISVGRTRTLNHPEGGTLYLAGGTYRITAEGDGISASGQCVILDGEYTVTAGGGSENAAQHTSGQAFFGGQRGGSRPSDGTSNGAHGEQQEPSQGSREKGGMGGRGGEVGE